MHTELASHVTLGPKYPEKALPSKRAMSGPGTHVNFGLALRRSVLRGTTPGAVRDRVAPHCSKRKSMPTVHEDHAGEGDAAAGAA
jgi:hypothetical protein